MSDTVKLNQCPKCGAPIPPGAPQGLCPKCILVAAATEAEPGPPVSESLQVPSIERIVAAFPNLEIFELIGHGGMGFVFKARQPNLDRFVALKLLPEELARDPRFAERFNREGRVLARLSHPNIVSVYDFGKTEHFYFLIMEFVDGVNLRQAMQAGRFSPAEALRVVPKICEALQYAHEQGVLHRDIKPANILLDTRGQVKIADFGIAKLVGDEKPDVTLTATGAAIGTPHYMAPEQLENPSEVDHRADIYSLGVVFYEMLTGELPIGRFPAPSSKTPVGEKVDEIVFRTLEKDREKRYQSAGEMKTQVEHLEPGQEASGPISPKFERASRVSRYALWGAVLVALSVPFPVLVVMSMLFRFGRIGPIELGLALFSVCVLGLIGTLLGWRGLNEIRQGAGRVSGLPLALFATLAWPLGALVGLVVGLPMVVVVPSPAGQETTSQSIGHFLVLLLPAGAITFGIWAVQACIHWARRQPPARHKGVLKWVFIGLLAIGLGAQLASRTKENPTTRPAPETNSVPAIPHKADGEMPQPIRANFRAVKGQVVTFEVLRRDNDTVTTVPNFASFAVTPDDERGRFSLELTPEASLPTQTNRPLWRLRMMTEEGAAVTGGVEHFGELIANLPMEYVHPIEPDSSEELMLTRPYATANTNDTVPHPRLSLSIVSQSRGRIGGPQVTTVLSVGSTNWAPTLQARALAASSSRPRPGEVLAHQWLKSPAGASSTNNIRFTFTNVGLRQEAGRDWMAMDYATDVHGDCEEVFRIDGDDLLTRKEAMLITPEGAPPVMRQRFLWRIPEKLNRTVVAELTDEFGKALVGKSFVVSEGEQRPLLRFPLGLKGDYVSVGIGARLRDTPAVKEMK